MSTIALHNGGAGAAAVKFSEREPYEKGFADVFDRQIAPGLAQLEEERLALRRSLLLRAILPALALIATIGLFVWAVLPGAPSWAVYVSAAALIATIALGIFAWMPATRFADKSRELIMGPVCGFLGELTYSRTGAFNLQRYHSCGIVGNYNKATVEDVFSGQHRGTRFEMAEAHLERRQGAGKSRNTQVVFRGLLIAVDLPEKTEGRILISRELGKLRNKISGWFTGWKGLKRVELPHPEFDKRFEVYADNPDDARRLLTPGFLDTMVAVANAHSKSDLKAGFVGDQFLLAMPINRNLFEPGSVFRSVYDCEQNIREVMGQITIAHRLIDFLKVDRPERLAS